MFDLLLLGFRYLWRRGKTLWFDLEYPGYSWCLCGQIPHDQCWSDVEGSRLADVGWESRGWGASELRMHKPLHPKPPFLQGSHKWWGHLQPRGGNLLQTREANTPANRPWEWVSLRSCSVKEIKEMRNVSTSNGEISIWSAVCLESNPSQQQHFFPLSSVYQFLLTTVSWLQEKQAQLRWYYILQLQTDHGD